MKRYFSHLVRTRGTKTFFFALGDSGSFFGLTTKVPPLGSTSNLDAGVKETSVKTAIIPCFVCIPPLKKQGQFQMCRVIPTRASRHVTSRYVMIRYVTSRHVTSCNSRCVSLSFLSVSTVAITSACMKVSSDRRRGVKNLTSASKFSDTSWSFSFHVEAL